LTTPESKNYAHIPNDVELDEGGTIVTRCQPYDVLWTRWTLSSGNKLVEQGSSHWEYSGQTLAVLLSKENSYALDIEVLPGASCLNAAHPRLRVATHLARDELDFLFIWLFLLPLGTGLVLLARVRFFSTSTSVLLPRIFPEIVLRNVLPLRRSRTLPIFDGLPNFGLLWGATLFVLILILILMISQHPPSRGLVVDFSPRNISHQSPWPETLSVYVDAQREYYVNGTQVPREQLRMKLQQELGKRMIWVVYFEAADDCLFMDVTYAFDAITGLKAKFVWITPRMRKELDQKTNEELDGIAEK
jgi:biopolymer transport protein ExbD